MTLRQWFRNGLIWMLFCCGCAGSSVISAYYTLQPVNGTHQPPDVPAGAQRVIGLGPVVLPQYLDRSVIVTRISPNRLILNDGHRWAGSLQSEIMRVLADNLGSRLHAKEVVLFPWNASAEPDSHFRVEIKSFEGRPGKNVTLKAAWYLTFPSSAQPVVHRVSEIQEKINGYGFEDLAAAMGRALAGLSDEMAGAVPKAAAMNQN
jgi:uncharacterized lipoprotein YmbA